MAADTETNRRIREEGSPGTWDLGRWVLRAAVDGGVGSADVALIAHAVNQLVPLSEDRDMLERNRDDWMRTAVRLSEERDHLRQLLRESVVAGLSYIAGSWADGSQEFRVFCSDSMSQERCARLTLHYANLIRTHREPEWVTKAIFK